VYSFFRVTFRLLNYVSPSGVEVEALCERLSPQFSRIAWLFRLAKSEPVRVCLLFQKPAVITGSSQELVVTKPCREIA
jgi:hypothetical protein